MKTMKLRWLIPVAVLLPMRVHATEPIKARVATVVINPAQITTLHLRPEFESTIRMPEEVTSVILGSPGAFKAEHNEGEPDYVYVKPITKEPAQSNLLIATKSGQHVTLELISGGAVSNSPTQPVDFLIEYRVSRSFLVASNVAELAATASTTNPVGRRMTDAAGSRSVAPSALDEEFEQQSRINAPNWTK
jgi:type IV secretory pathway VirB9-like protein